MFSFLKKLLKRILPPPVHSFVREMDDLRGRIGMLEKHIDSLKEEIDAQTVLINKLTFLIKDQAVDEACRKEETAVELRSACEKNELHFRELSQRITELEKERD